MPAYAMVVGGGEERPASSIHYLHGIYGAGRNWRSVAGAVALRRPSWGGVLVDLRLHGDSRGFEPPHDLRACADDLRRLAADPHGPGSPDALLGHSFGGKVALTLLERPPESLRQLWLVDASPSARPPAGSAVEVLEALRELPGPFPDRSAAISELETRGFASAVAKWMATNLESGEEGWGWRFRPDELESLLEDFFATDLWGIVDRSPASVELHVVKAAGSGALTEDDCSRVEAAGRSTGHVHLHRVSGGHWLNVDNPDALVDLLVRHLPERGPGRP